MVTRTFSRITASLLAALALATAPGLALADDWDHATVMAITTTGAMIVATGVMIGVIGVTTVAITGRGTARATAMPTTVRVRRRMRRPGGIAIRAAPAITTPTAARSTWWTATRTITCAARRTATTGCATTVAIS